MIAAQSKFGTVIERADPRAALMARTSPYVSSTRHGLSPRSRSAGGPRRERLRIAVLAPPWFPVPPPAYGGIEAVVDLLCQELVARGHDVTLFAAPGSHSDACLRTPLEAAHPHEIGSSMVESDCVACAWGEVDLAGELDQAFDVVHDHSGFTALAMADRIDAPVVHTIHGAFVEETVPFYQRHGHRALLVAISRSQALSAPAGVRIADVVPNPVVVERWPLRTEKQDYLLWVGRMDPVKGAHRAIRAARLAGRKLVLAGPIQAGQEAYYHELVEPQIDNSTVRYIGEVGGIEKQELFADAAALLMPIGWREPFGMVMVEALACGTPVIAFPEGAASEIVIDGVNGMLVADEAEMASAVDRLDSIDAADCRASVAARYDISITASGYEAVYDRAIEVDRQRAGWGRRPARLTRRPLRLGAL